MDKFRSAGGRPLEGEIAISGAKNLARPGMAGNLMLRESSQGDVTGAELDGAGTGFEALKN